MKIAILEIYPNKKFDTKNAIDAHLRNSLILANILNADLLLTENDYKKAMNYDYDILILSYFSFYAPFNNIKQLLQKHNNKPFYYISNEYNNERFASKDMKFNLICNYENPNISKFIHSYNIINLNLLLAKQQNELTNKKYDCLYYGTFRIDRNKYFKEYLQENIYLSTSNKNLKKYKHIGCNPKYIGKLNWNNKQETLNNFKYSLYIEDVYTHSNYNHLANRFYESLFCNVVQFFDINCKNTIEKSGIEFDNYFYVKNYNELIAKINETNENDNWNKAMQFQSQWNIQALQQKEQMINELKTILGI